MSFYLGYYPPSVDKEYNEDSEGDRADYFSSLCYDWEAAAKLPPEINVRQVIVRTGSDLPLEVF